MRALLLALLLLAPAARAQFAEPHLGDKLAFGQKSTQLIFVADAPIKRAKPNCDCTTVHLAGDNKQQLVANVDVTSFDKDTSRHIDVWMEDGRKTRVHMSFVVPQAVILSAKSLKWARNSTPTPQTLTLQLPQGSPVTALKDASLVGEDFSYETKAVKAGSQYRLTITPRNTAKKALNRLYINTVSRDPQHARLIIYLKVD